MCVGCEGGPIKREKQKIKERNHNEEIKVLTLT